MRNFIILLFTRYQVNQVKETIKEEIKNNDMGRTCSQRGKLEMHATLQSENLK
jgi:hypothetical protein